MEFYNSKGVRTRKHHRCELCGILIPSGSTCHYESGKYDGEFFSRHTHDECSKEWARQNREAEHGDEWFWFECQEDGDQAAWNKAIREKYLINHTTKQSN